MLHFLAYSEAPLGLVPAEPLVQRACHRSSRHRRRILAISVLFIGCAVLSTFCGRRMHDVASPEPISMAHWQIARQPARFQQTMGTARTHPTARFPVAMPTDAFLNMQSMLRRSNLVTRAVFEGREITPSRPSDQQTPGAFWRAAKAKIKRWWKAEPIGAPYAAHANAYDPAAANKFYLTRPFVVISRLFKLLTSTLGFFIRLLRDLRSYRGAGRPEGKPWPNEKDRAKEALELAMQLGPTFIKLAQAMSIRTDLIPEAYALELRKLQDKVRPFDSKEAKEIIAQELNVSSGPSGLSSIFSSFSAEPLASASIGQVYKAVLRDGRTVAVKVQRPNILDTIALDLYLLRLLAPLQSRISNAINNAKTHTEDIKLAQELVDEWGRGFVAEADYLTEAANAERFSEAMERRGLSAVMSPAVVKELTTSKVLVTDWVDGTRLDLDASPDVPRLCGIAINSYLTMLLDTGVLHCDPHPGNLLRTRDGKLCILDWGMTLAVPTDLQYSILEFVAHVNAEDYDAMLNDFVNLGFSPPDKLDRLRAANLTEGLSFALRQLSQGGGRNKLLQRVRQEFQQKYNPDGLLTMEEVRAKLRKEFLDRAREQLEADGVQGAGVMNVQKVMEKMGQRNRELFKVPPYVLYVTRAFSTLEGIGLSADEDYSIVNEAFPYLSKRLLTDNSPRAKAALRSLVYGSKDKVASSATPDLTKMVSIGKGFTSYTKITSQVPGRASSLSVDGAKEDLIDLLLSPDGNHVQELLLEEAAKITDAAVRGSIAKIPIFNKIARANETDEEVLKAFAQFQERRKVRLVAPDGKESTAGGMGQGVQQMLANARMNTALLNQLVDSESRLRRRLPLVGSLLRRFWAILLLRVAKRLEEDAELPGVPDLARQVAARMAKAYRSIGTSIERSMGTSIEPTKLA